jgi:hypothetical protein
VSWNTANAAVLAEGRRMLIDDASRFDGVAVIGVDEHVWCHSHRGDRYVTVIIDLTSIRNGTGPARLLDMVAGRSKQVFKTWLGERRESRRAGGEVSECGWWLVRDRLVRMVRSCCRCVTLEAIGPVWVLCR